eukprot:4146885-Alexandrium_andersonii.AAC.1
MCTLRKRGVGGQRPPRPSSGRVSGTGTVTVHSARAGARRHPLVQGPRGRNAPGLRQPPVLLAGRVLRAQGRLA